MKIIRTILLVLVGLFVLYVKLETASSPGGGQGMAVQPPPSASSMPVMQPSADMNAAIPPKALQVVQIVRTTGLPPDGYVGGRVFENREGRLPAGGDYREFDVDPHNGNRNAERIIVEWRTKKAWYTGDHYQTFLPLP